MEDEQLALGTPGTGPVQCWGQDAGLERRSCSEDRGETDPVWERTEKGIQYNSRAWFLAEHKVQ